MNKDALSPRLKKKFAAYSVRKRAPNEALPRTLSVYAQPPYVPKPDVSVRPGADDHLKVQSRGYRT